MLMEMVVSVRITAHSSGLIVGVRVCASAAYAGGVSVLTSALERFIRVVVRRMVLLLASNCQTG